MEADPMWRREVMRNRVGVALLGISTLALIGASAPWKKGDKPPKVDETIADITDIFSHSDLRLEGVGLVVGLDNTGRDAPPSWYREHLIDEMQKAGVENPN